MSPAETAHFPDPRRDGTWPRVYRMTRRQRLVMYVTGVGALAAGLASAGGALFLRQDKAAPLLIGLVALMGLAFIVGGVYLIAAAGHKRVLLFEDAIEFVDLGYGRRRLRRDEIRGLRIIPLQYGFHQIVFELHGRKPVKADIYCEHDDALYAWLDAIPNLDVQDQARAATELLQRPELGNDEEERRWALDVAYSITRAGTALTVVAGAWALFYPRPYEAAILALVAIPLVALALLVTGRGRYSTTENDRNEIRPSLWVSLFMPGMILVIRVLADIRVVDWQRSLLWAVLASLALTALVVASDPAARRRWYAPLGVLALFTAYPWGALQMANMLLDRAAPETYRVKVLEKHISSGKGPNHHLHLAPWGPRPADQIDVGRALYDSVEVGGTVCVRLRPGALGVRWFSVRSCDGLGERPAEK